MQAIGICRFSYPALGGFQVEHETVEDRVTYLFDPARIETRFAIFEAFTLPCLRAQTDPDFTFVIVIGDLMPVKYETRLRRLVEDFPQVVVQTHAPGPHRKVMKKAINSVRRDPSAVCVQFRLDDDDAVGIDFIARLKEAAGRAMPLLVGERTVAIDFNQGHVAAPSSEGIRAAAVTAQSWSPALGMLIAAGADLTVMNFAHQKVWRTMPTISLPGRDMMLRGHTAFNDSRQKDRVRSHRLVLLDPVGEAHFRKTYNVDADDVRRLFSALHQSSLAIERE